MQQPIHLLTKLGILTAFSVAKKVTEQDVNNFFKKYKKAGKTEEEIGVMLRDKIFGEIKEAMEKRKIPGLLTPLELVDKKVEEIISKNFSELNKMIMIVSNKLIEKKYDKLSLCYFVNSLVNLLGLSEKDFENFHKKMSNQNNDDDGDTDEE